jgi:hypothetical protein
MTDATGRRTRARAAKGGLRAAWLASAVAVLPLAALAYPSAAAVARSAALFAPGSDTMVLTRVLRRPLPGGAEVATSRSYEIRFVRESAGYRVDGKLISVDVDVPPAFEALAELERARPDTGMFPVHVDDHGRFVAAGGERPGQFALQASRVALAQLPQGLPQGEARDARSFIEQVGANPVHTAWPDDLFMPAPGKRDDRHVVPLPGGKTGEVAVAIDASVDAVTGLVTTLKRHVTTPRGSPKRPGRSPARTEQAAQQVRRYYFTSLEQPGFA